MKIILCTKCTEYLVIHTFQRYIRKYFGINGEKTKQIRPLFTCLALSETVGSDT